MKTTLFRIQASDADEGPNELSYRLVSGNEPALIRIDRTSGQIFFERWFDDVFLDWDGRTTRNVTVQVSDSGAPPRWDWCQLELRLDWAGWSGSAPSFPLPVYRVFLPESARESKLIAVARAVDRLGRSSPLWRYSLVHNDESFTVEPSSGRISLARRLDFEQLDRFEFTVQCTDERRRSASAQVVVLLIGVDEHAPLFTKPTYSFLVPWSTAAGQHLGRVHATDEDKGEQGVVRYSLADPSISSVGLDPDSGVLTLLRPLSRLGNQSTEEFAVIASSSPTQFSRASVTLLFSDDADRFADVSEERLAKLNRLLGCFAVSALVLTVLVCFCFLCTRRAAARKPAKHVYSVAKGNVAVMADVERLSPSYTKSPRPSATPVSAPVLQTGPPEGVKLRETAGSRSQPDSGIDPDVLSLSSGAADLYSQLSARQCGGAELDVSELVLAQVLSAPLAQPARGPLPKESVRPTVTTLHPRHLQRQVSAAAAAQLAAQLRPAPAVLLRRRAATAAQGVDGRAALTPVSHSRQISTLLKR